MKKTILITGASSGIGAACVTQAMQLNLNVIATARSKSKLQQYSNTDKNIQIIVADISTETGRNKIAKSIEQPIDFLLHNAAILNQPQKFIDLTLTDFRNNMATNVEPILFLTQLLFPNLKKNVRILNLSSGAAKQAIAGLGNYCVSKAAALMTSQILKVELQKQGILVNDYFPGVVDTQMQKTLRNSNIDILPYSDNFKQMKIEQQLNNPLHVAAHILEIFTNTKDQKFSQMVWTFKTRDAMTNQ